MLNIFKKKTKVIDVIDFDASDISTGQIGGYILDLYEKKGFRHIGYRFENIDGNCRFVIYTLISNKAVIQYFKDRCSAIVEYECKASQPSSHTFSEEWYNDYKGFTEVLNIRK